MNLIISFVIAVVAVGVDQLTKYLAATYLMPLGSVPIWQDVLHLTYVENTGAAFGMLKGQRWLFLILSTVAVIAIAVFMIVRRKQLTPMLGISLGLILGGGIGNQIDRFINGYVVDFIDFTLIDFAVFNGADSCVCVGAALLFLYVILLEIRERRAAKQAAEVKTGDKL